MSHRIGEWRTKKALWQAMSKWRVSDRDQDHMRVSLYGARGNFEWPEEVTRALAKIISDELPTLFVKTVHALADDAESARLGAKLDAELVLSEADAFDPASYTVSDGTGSVDDLDS